jgi:hypothetical protein
MKTRLQNELVSAKVEDRLKGLDWSIGIRKSKKNI